MKARKMNRRLLLCVVLTLAIIGTFLVPGAASAADQDWPLTLVGASTVTVSQAEFEAMAAANPAVYTDPSTGDNWTGVALWRLIALVDDADPATFNDALASVYSVAMTAADDYTKTVAPPYAGVFEFAHAENIMVANQLNGAALPMTSSSGKMWYPLRVTGAGCTLNNQRVGGLVQIELANLPETPATAVSISPASQSVANGGSFVVDVAIDTETAARGWQVDVDFDAAKMQYVSIAEGGFLKEYAAANGGSTIPGSTPGVDNVNGHVTDISYAMLGAGSDGPSGTGILCTLEFTANDAVDSIASLGLSGVVVSDVTGTSIADVAITGGTVAIGSVPMPDLVVTAVAATKDGEGTYAIAYTIKNQGSDPAAASSTAIVVDGGTPIVVACPALDAGATDNQTLAGQAFTGPTDTIVVSADSAGAVSESNEGNNSRQVIYATAGGAGDVIINGNILAALALTVPDDILDWNLQVGANSMDGTANVKGNTSWQLQVNDQNADTNGHMTKWQTDTYDPTVQLVNALNVGCESTVELSTTNQLIADGETSGQLGGNGEDMTVTFSQQVEYSDPVLTGGYSYHVVVTFTASSTI